MPQKPQGKAILLLCLKFAILAPICLVVWLYVLPVYAGVLAHFTAAVLKWIFRKPITGIAVVNLKPDAVLNTGIAIKFTLGYLERTMPSLGSLTTNVAPFVALVLATPGLALLRRLRILALGVGIIVLGHAAMIVIAFMSREAALPKAIGFIAITLPFLLWIVLAYWDKLAAYFAIDGDPGDQGG